MLHSDDEAAALWANIAGLRPERIQRRGLLDNYWHMGVPGPGGPCSEIYIDRGPEYGPDGGPIVDEDRFLEIWNLVFMQEELSAVRAKDDFDVARPLPRKNIDTGMGLERVAYLLQGVDNLYEIDQVYPVIAHAAELGRARRTAPTHDDDVRLRVVADHIRSGLMLIGDGVTPGNEARGYVLRRLLRRVVRAMRLLGVAEPVLPELLPISRDLMAESYPELSVDWDRISQIAYAEEEAFRRTLTTGTQIFDLAVRDAKTAEETDADRRPGVPAPRHVRLPDRPDPGDGGRAGPDRRRAELPPADAGAEGPGQGRRQGQEGRRPGRARSTASCGPAGRRRSPATPSWPPSPRSAASSRDGELVEAAEEGDVVEVVLEQTPSTPSPAARTPTPARSPATGCRWRWWTCRRPVKGLIVHRVRVTAGRAA